MRNPDPQEYDCCVGSLLCQTFFGMTVFQISFPLSFTMAFVSLFLSESNRFFQRMDLNQDQNPMIDPDLQ